ncbi:MAG: DegT/DnrJ/EryC1/StrS aminotransferase family protein [Planctomycetota bacterium]
MSRSSERIPFHRPSITDAEIDAVVECLKSGWLTMGPKVRAFEERFAEHVGARHAIAVSSGTAAMFLALRCSGVGEGHEVLTTPYTFVATLEVIEDCGARPVLLDVNPESAALEPATVGARLGSAARAILPVHVGGHPVDMEGFEALANGHDLVLVDDAAHALGARSGTAAIGGIGTATAFSFYASKNLTTAEGGMITCGDDGLAEELRLARLHGLSRDAWRRDGGQRSWTYDVIRRGTKANLSDLAAALGLAQLERYRELDTRRREIAARYDLALAGCDLLERPPRASGGEHAWHLYMVRLKLERLLVDRDTVLDLLDAEGIQCSVHFRPLHLMTRVREWLGVGPGDFPAAEALGERVISLPIYPGLTDVQVDRVAETLCRVLEEQSAGGRA